MGTSSRSSSTLKIPFQTFKSFYTIQRTTRTIRMKFILMLSLTVLVASQVVTSASVPFVGVECLSQLNALHGTMPAECDDQLMQLIPAPMKERIHASVVLQGLGAATAKQLEHDMELALVAAKNPNRKGSPSKTK